LEDVVDVTRFKQRVLGGLALPEEGHVRQQIVAHSDLIEMLDAATFAPVDKIAQPLRVRLDSLVVFEQGFLGKERFDLIHDPLAIGIAVWLDRYAAAHSLKRSLPAQHCFDCCLEIHPYGFVFRPVPQVERTRDLFLGAPPPPSQINRNVAPVLPLPTTLYNFTDNAIFPPQNLIPRFGGNTLKSVSRAFQL
jgi:hypothetical protein